MKCRACKGTGEVHGFDAFYETVMDVLPAVIGIVMIVRAIAWAT